MGESSEGLNHQGPKIAILGFLARLSQKSEIRGSEKNFSKKSLFPEELMQNLSPNDYPPKGPKSQFLGLNCTDSFREIQYFSFYKILFYSRLLCCLSTENCTCIRICISMCVFPTFSTTTN